MKQRVFIIHGWDGYPEDGWYPWLKKELEDRGFEVHVPALPDTKYPKYQPWVAAIAAAVGEADSSTYFVGHSMGCPAIGRYLETLPEGSKVGGAVFVAGFFRRLTNLEHEDRFQEIADNWLVTPIDFTKIASHLPQSIAIFSDNDHYVPLDNADDFRDHLHSDIRIFPKMGHFTELEGYKELPIVRDALLELME